MAVNHPPDLPTVDLDTGRMAQVVRNLLSNAIKYTPAEGIVKVTAGVDREAYWFCVADSGPGIIQEEQEKVFEPFFRSTQQCRFPQGLGLGLTIARDLVAALGGTLKVESDPEVGSQFTARLPIN